MPVPIGLVGMPSSTSWKENNDTMGIALNDLTNAAAIANLGRTSSMNMLSEANDTDAEVLLELWKQAAIVSEAETAEDKRYAVPKDFSNEKLMRLKSASLVHGDTNVIRFTAKAARVIKTIVLSEANVYAKDAVRKPYSVIMAEAKARAANMSTLAFQKTAELQSYAQRNAPIPGAYMPTRNSPYIETRRIVKCNPSENEHKQYILRLFHINDMWVVMGWNGRNEAGRPLMPQPKGYFNSQAVARGVMESVLSAKQADGYRPAGNTNHPDLLGVPEDPIPAAPAPAPIRQVPVRPTPARLTPTPQSTPKPETTEKKPAKQTHKPEVAESVMPSNDDVDAWLEDLGNRESLLD